MKNLQCGFAQNNITPDKPEQVFLDGYGFRLSPATDVLDPIYAKVCLMKWEQREFAIISLDVCGLNNQLKDSLCERISLLANIKREHFALCATHTHAGPACGVLANLPINMLYWNKVANKITQAIEQARNSAKEGSFRFALPEEFDLPKNRRGKEDINKNIWVCGFYDIQNTLQGVITAASCHAVCNLEYTISADFPGVLTRRGEQEYKGVPFMFLQSRGADINPPCSGREGIEKMGNQLSDHVFSALKKMGNSQQVKDEIRSAFKNVCVPMHFPSEKDLKKAIETLKEQVIAVLDDDAARRDLDVELQWNMMALTEVQSGNTSPTLPVDLQVLTLGNQAMFAFIPFEVLTTTGNALEQALCSLGFPQNQCFVVAYANGTNSYLCPAAECGKPGYETCQASHWYMLPESCKFTEPTVISTLVELTKSLL